MTARLRRSLPGRAFLISSLEPPSVGTISLMFQMRKPRLQVIRKLAGDNGAGTCLRGSMKINSKNSKVVQRSCVFTLAALATEVALQPLLHREVETRMLAAVLMLKGGKMESS